MEAFSALLVHCAGNLPVTGELPSQRPVTRSFDVFFDLRLNRQLSTQSWGWWFETPSRPLWRHCNRFWRELAALLRHRTVYATGTKWLERCLIFNQRDDFWQTFSCWSVPSANILCKKDTVNDEKSCCAVTMMLGLWITRVFLVHVMSGRGSILADDVKVLEVSRGMIVISMILNHDKVWNRRKIIREKPSTPTLSPPWRNNANEQSICIFVLFMCFVTWPVSDSATIFTQDCVWIKD